MSSFLRKVQAGAMSELSISIEEYFENEDNQDDYEDLVKLAEDKNKFLSSPLAARIAKAINPKMTPDLFYGYFD